MVAGLAGEQAQVPEIPHYAAARLDQVHHADSASASAPTSSSPARASRATRSSRALEGSATRCWSSATASTLKIHVHTDDPEAAKALFADAGEVTREDIADMHEQVADQRARLGAGRTGVVAVAGGDGMKSMFKSLGATVVDGGPTLNPSTQDLLAAIERCPGDEVVVLPNSRNVIMAAEEAARLAGKEGRTVVVVPSTAQQAALAALVELDPRTTTRPPTPSGCRAGSGEIRVGAVAPAARDDAEGRFVRGDSVGFAGDEIVAWGGAGSTLVETVRRALRGRRDRHGDRGGRGTDRDLTSSRTLLPSRRRRARASRGGTANYSWLHRRPVSLA